MDEQLNNPTPAANAPAQEAATSVDNAPQPPSELEQMKALAEENLAGWKRATADYANLKKEMERASADLAKYAVAGFINKLLPVVDSFRKATEQNPLAGGGDQLDMARIKQWVDGVGHIRGQFDNVLAGVGVTAIATKNIPFDPAMHEAMLMQKVEGVAAGTVISVLEPGYLLHEKVIRPAKVVVAE